MYRKLIQIGLLIHFCLTFTLTSYTQEPVIPSDSLLQPPVDSLGMTAVADTSNHDNHRLSGSPVSDDAVDAPIHYTAKDSILFDVKNQKVYLYKEATVQYKEIELKSDYIEIDLEKQEVFARGVIDSAGKETGQPTFKDGDDSFEAQSMRYNYKTKKGLIKGVFTEQPEGFLHSECAKRLPEGDVSLKGGKFTTCNDKEHPHFYILLSKARVIPDDKIVTGPALLVIEDMPIPVGIPFGFFPNTKRNKSGVIIPEYGEEENRGFFLRNGGYYFAISDYFHSSIKGDIYSKGSWATNVHTNYKKRYKFNGNMDFRYSQNKISEYDLPDYQKRIDYWIRWSHSQDPKARPNSTFSASVDFGSSSYHKYSTYTNPDLLLRNTTQSSISYQKRFPNSPFSMNLNLLHSQNSKDSTVSLTLPFFSVNMSRIFLSDILSINKKGYSTWYSVLTEKIGLSMQAKTENRINNIKEKKLFTPAIYDYMNNGIWINVPVSTTFKILKYVSVSPSFNTTGRGYFRTTEKSLIKNSDSTYITREDTVYGFKGAYDYTLNTSLSTRLYAMYSFKKLPVKAIRHVISPSVNLTYHPDFAKQKYGYYKSYIKDTLGTQEIYSVFENGIYGTPPTKFAGTISGAITNNVEMKVRNRKDTVNQEKKITLIDNFTVSASYNLGGYLNDDTLNCSNISLSGYTKIFKYFDIRYGAQFDPYILVYDTLLKRTKNINQYEWKVNNRIARIENSKWNIGLNLNLTPEMFNKNKTEKKEPTEKPPFNPNDYIDFDLPWSLNINYNLLYTNIYNYNRKPTPDSITREIVQSVRFDGQINLTEKWKISFDSGYDFKNKKITYTSVTISRDLHCWEMNLNVVPFGNYKQYSFRINVKPGVLQDLKFNRNRSWYDNI